jgi:hypothetical protein
LAGAGCCGLPDRRNHGGSRGYSRSNRLD